MVEHTFDPWIAKLVGPILAIQGSGERYWLGLCIHGSFETNQNGGLVQSCLSQAPCFTMNLL